jgi:hypothetical protein
MRFSLIIGNVDQSLPDSPQAGKRTELGQTGDGSSTNMRAGSARRAASRVFQQLANGQANAFLVAVNADHLHFDFLTNLQHLGRMLNAIPGNLGEVHQTVCAGNIDESTKNQPAR